MIPLDRVQQIVNTYKTLERELASANIDKKDFVKKSKEYSNIGEVINQAKGYLSFEKEKIELKKNYRRQRKRQRNGSISKKRIQWITRKK